MSDRRDDAPPAVPPLRDAERGIGGEAPVVRWTGDRELLGWRAWRLGLLVDERGQDCGPRLLSLSAPCIWDGPAVRVEVAPSAPPENPSGIYALKPAVAERSAWPLGDYCWVTGTVALSGRVVEHALGYRAESPLSASCASASAPTSPSAPSRRYVR